MNALDNFGPEFQLVWPKKVFSDEANEIAALPAVGDNAELLLEEAFAGQEPIDEFRKLHSHWGPTPSKSGREYLRRLANSVDQFPGGPTPYWIGRQGSVLGQQSILTWQEVQDQWRRSVDDLEERGYLDRIAPRRCVDGDEEDPAAVIRAEVLRRTGLRVEWPQVPGANSLEPDTFYTLVEVLHDLIARPRTRSYHDFAGCGWHFSDFAISTGQALYRARVNEAFTSGEVGLVLAESGLDRGRLVRTAADGRRDLLDGAVTRAESPENAHSSDADDLLHAVELFRARGASRRDRKSACVTLAGVLERRRADLKTQLLSKDESALFQIANLFALRHQNANQRDDYGDDYLDWVFWIYLATIELTDRLAHRTAGQ